MNSLLFLYNPQAGKGQVRPRLAEILEAFTSHGWLVTARPTLGPGEATTLAAQLGGQFDRVVCSGGDGTLNEVISGLLTLEDPPVLGYIPAGTTNDFARNLHLPSDMEAAARTAVTGPVFHCDIGKFNDRNFAYVAAFGAFTQVTYNTPQEFKSAFGHLAYLLSGAASLGSIRPIHLAVQWEGGFLEDDFIFGMVSNTISVGGFKGLTGKDVVLDDGMFEVTLVRHPRTPAQLQAIITALADRTSGGPLLSFHTAHLTLTATEDLPWTLDGEYGGSPKTAEITNLPRALSIVTGTP